MILVEIDSFFYSRNLQVTCSPALKYILLFIILFKTGRRIYLAFLRCKFRENMQIMIIFFSYAAKNGIYFTLVKDVRNAFEGSPLVKINCQGLDPSDYKKIGAKLKVCGAFG